MLLALLTLCTPINHQWHVHGMQALRIQVRLGFVTSGKHVATSSAAQTLYWLRSPAVRRRRVDLTIAEMTTQATTLRNPRVDDAIKAYMIEHHLSLRLLSESNPEEVPRFVSIV